MRLSDVLPDGLPWRRPVGRRRRLTLRRRRRNWLIGGAALLVVLVAAPFVWWEWFGPERFEDVELGRVPPPLGAPEGTPAGPPLALGAETRVFLVFSTGSAGVSDEEARRLRLNDLGDRGNDNLTDTMMLLVTDPATRTAALVSIPRDLWLFDRGHRINETFARHGLQDFVDDVSRVTGLPIHHLVQLNFTAFADLVDAVGGVALRVDRPLADLYSVLYVPEAGCWRFEGPDALAYARSRHTLTRRDGRWVVDRTASDLFRAQRQQALLGAAWDQLRGTGVITKIPSLLQLVDHGMKIDDELGVRDIVALARTFRDVAAGRVESYVLPTRGQRIRGAAAQVLIEEQAQPLLARLRSWPPDDEPSGTAWQSTPLVPGLDLAAGQTSPPGVQPHTLPSQPGDCSRDAARRLPDPRGPLLDVARARRPRTAAPSGGGEDGGDAATTTGDQPDGPDEPEPTPSPTTSAQPTPPPSEQPSPEPSPTPCPLLDPSCLGPGGEQSTS